MAPRILKEGPPASGHWSSAMCPLSSGQSYSRKRCSQRNKTAFSSISRYCTSRPHSFPKTYSHCPRKGFFLSALLSHSPLPLARFSGLIGSILPLTPTTLLLAVFQNLLLPTPAQGGQKRGSQQGTQQSLRTLRVEWYYVQCLNEGFI